MTTQELVLNFTVALGLGAVIGLERQWRQRLAGLRTNALVALGAAIFTGVGTLFAGDSPSRIAAQVVSGIGFLGAGVIMREGLNIRGLNTAATLWCAAAVGVLAATGYRLEAAMATGLILVANLALRPLVSFINRLPLKDVEGEHLYRVTVVCRSAEEAHIRALLLQGTGGSSLRLQRLDSRDIEAGTKVEVRSLLSSVERSDGQLEGIVGRMSLEASVSAARWEVEVAEL